MKKIFIVIFAILITPQIIKSIDLGAGIFFNYGGVVDNWRYNDFAEAELKRYEMEISPFSFGQMVNREPGEVHTMGGLDIEPQLKLEKYLMIGLPISSGKLPVKSFFAESYDKSVAHRFNIEGNYFSFGIAEYYILNVKPDKVDFKFGIGFSYYKGKLTLSKESTTFGYRFVEFENEFNGKGFAYFTKFLIDIKIARFLSLNLGLLLRVGQVGNFETKDKYGNKLKLYTGYAYNGCVWVAAPSKDNLINISELENVLLDLSGPYAYLGINFYFEI